MAVRNRTAVGALIAFMMVAVPACGSAATQDARDADSNTTTSSTPERIEIGLASWRLPEPRTRVSAAFDGSSIVVLGGQNQARVSVADVLRIDPTTGAQRKGNPLLSRLHDGAAVSTPGDRSGVWYLGGGDAIPNGTVQLANEGSSTTELGTLPEPNADLAAASSGAATYVVGGYNGRTILDGVFRSENGSQWTRVATLLEPVRYAAVAIAAGALWIFGGTTASGPTASIQRVDLATGAISQAGQLPGPLTGAAAVAVRDTMLIVGGRVQERSVSSVWRFDPGTNQTVLVGNLATPVAYGALVANGDTAYVIGGQDDDGATATVATIHLV